ncbi:MAG TPA: VOC family protein [Polyangiales bacterium]|nr:VOC family protein [Polyangiales bacterium]
MGVQGIGGLFFRARDPEALSAWYREHLGVGGGCGPNGVPTDEPWCWQITAGPVVFTPFAATTDYFPSNKQWMLNLRVTELDELVARLTAAGIAAERRAEWDDPKTGRFARIYDPEGNAIELWEPPR